MRFFYLFVVLFVFVGCDNSRPYESETINLVKQVEIQGLKNGELIDNFKDFKKVTWKDSNLNGEKIVTATCEIKDEILKNEFDSKVASKFNEINSRYKDYLKTKEMNLKNKYDFFIEMLSIRSSNSTKQIPTLKEVVNIANKYCKLQNSKDIFLSPNESCNKELLKKELLKYTGVIPDSFFDGFIQNSIIDIYNIDNEKSDYSWFIYWLNNMPKKIESRSYDIIFIIDKDKTVKYKDTIMFENGKESKRGLHILRNILENRELN